MSRPEVLSRRGFSASLAVAQIDHTPMDVIVVNEEHRRSIQRPSLTIVIDVCSRMVLGFAIYLEKPSAFTDRRTPFTNSVLPFAFNLLLPPRIRK